MLVTFKNDVDFIITGCLYVRILYGVFICIKIVQSIKSFFKGAFYSKTFVMTKSYERLIQYFVHGNSVTNHHIYATDDSYILFELS